MALLRRLQTLVILLGGLTPALHCAEAAAERKLDSKYTGAGSCSSVSCHGSLQARSSTSVLQNEYSTWAVQDKHARAYTALQSENGKRMGRILHLQPESSPRCLSCHSLFVPAAEKARTVDIDDGVSCESCHGPASEWLGPHTTRDWNYGRSLGLGMYDTRDLVKRNEKCLSCHLGDSTKSVNHELIAAGHPDLYFEIDSFTAVEPKHWKEPFPADEAIEFRTLAVGQAVQLREYMRRIAREAAAEWPEFSELECFACHHSLTSNKASWRQEQGFPGRRPGAASWNASRFVILRIIANQVDSGMAHQLESQAGKVASLVADLHSDRNQLASAAGRAAETADQISNTFLRTNLTGDQAARLMKSICADSERISNAGERAAEQSAMVLNSLYVASVARSPKDTNAQLRSALGELFQQFESPSAYNPNTFAKRLRDVGSLVAGKP